MTYYDPKGDEEKINEEEVKAENYRKLFKDLGLQKSSKLCEYYKMKILSFNTDYKNERRIFLVNKLKEMRKYYIEVFSRDII
jgi:hypothetical protein